ncbi:hypothetical protein STRDD10_00062 [Streptococcus sp. DD10]|uniref:DUF1803 domain-containing protein n=1 Tax=Streptococcus sp. DD10 TaxID=1777878 RepID=UPI0007919B8F|nr:DUF1803 domain-containing protein [Streptococcus sp. DD10]KXT77177.1 hypothetical protein STRDD10_00062 [Streptococcus sp. DD10]
MIEIINPSRLCQQSFFRELVEFINKKKEVTLREIKHKFPTVAVDRRMEQFIKAGFILRENRRYSLSLPLLEDLSSVSLDQEIFIDTTNPLYEELKKLRFQTELKNGTNQAILIEQTDIFRSQRTLSNYFYKLQKQYPLSEEQMGLYRILGDVNPDYALKYMTTFLLKYVRKNELMQKRRDIFVDSLVELGYISQNQLGKYELQIEFDPEQLVFRVIK